MFTDEHTPANRFLKRNVRPRSLAGEPVPIPGPSARFQKSEDRID